MLYKKINIITGHYGSGKTSVALSCAAAINKKGFNIDKKMIKPLVPVDTLGVHNVDIELHKKVIAVAKIEVKEV